MFSKVAELINKGEEKAAYEYYTLHNCSVGIIIDEHKYHINAPLAEFMVKNDIVARFTDFTFSEAKAIDIIFKARPDLCICCNDDLSQQVAEEWCSEHKVIYYYRFMKENVEFDLKLIDQIYQSNFASIYPYSYIGRNYFDYSDDLIHKLRKIHKRNVLYGYQRDILLIVKKEEDYKKILDYTAQELKLQRIDTKKAKKELFKRVSYVNGFEIHPLTLDMPLGNFDDYYYSNSIKQLSESAMLYLIKTKKMTKQWSSMLSLNQIKFLAKNGFTDFSSKNLKKLNNA